MEEAREQDQYTERLKEVFHSFDASDTGSLSPEELSDLCQSLHLGEATPALLHALLQTQDCLTGRVDFNRFKNALILVLSSRIEAPRAELEAFPPPDSPEIQPKFVKGSKRYGRRSTPETILGFSEVPHHRLAEGDVLHGNNEDSPFPRKRERWNAHETSTEEYEAVGELQLWNPDEPTTPRRSMVPLSDRLEEKLQQACEELSLPWDGLAEHDELLALCDHIALEITGDVIQSLTGDGVMNVKEFVSRVVNHSTPPTPSSSTPYRQLKRHHSTQTFDETGRRITTPSSMTSTLSLRLFSTLDDGTGHTLAEDVLDAWFQEGVRNSAEILQALDFSLDGKLNLAQLTTALENELLVTKNGIHQAALASFKAEIRHLLERVDLELREKEKVCSNLEKAEKLKSQLATEVDERHSAIERTNNLNLRKLEQDHKEKLAATRLELITEMDRIQQQAGLQREKLEAEVQKVREDEVLLRDHLSMSVKENRRLEMDLLDSSERLTEAQSQITKLQTNLEKVLKEKFGGLDPCSVDFFLQDERIKQLRNSYEAQCRELQDRIDELHSELQEFHTLGRLPQPCSKPLSEDLESKSPGMESDPGLGSDEGQPFIMSLEAEMMLEALKEQHLREMEDLRAQLDSKMGEFDQKIEEQKAAHDTQKAAISLQHQEEIQALREEMAIVQRHAQKLQNQVELEQASLEKRHAKEQEELEDQQDQEVGTLRQQLLEAHMHAADLEEQLSTLEAQQAQIELNLDGEMEKLKRHHALDLRKLEERREVLLEARLEEERMRTQEEMAGVQKGLQEDWEREKDRLQQNHKVELSARLEEAAMRFQEESDALVKRLTDEWQRERSQLDEQRNESLQAVLEEEMMRLIKEHEEKERKLREQWEGERAQLLKSQEEVLLARLTEETLKVHGQSEQREKKLKEEWEIERLQLEEDYEGMLQERLDEEREKLEAEKEEVGKQLERLLNKEKTLLEESHGEALQELSAKHSEERAELHQLLDKLRGEIIEERSETSRLAEENLKLGNRISALKDEDLKEAKQDLLQRLEHFRMEKSAAEEIAESLKKQISELHLRSQQLEDENELLSQKNEENVADVEEISQQLAELMQENERREAAPAEDRSQMAACVSALEAELTKALEDSEQLKERNSQLTQQLSGLGEKLSRMDTVEEQLKQLLQERRTSDKETQGLRNQLVRIQERAEALDESLQAVNLQTARLKSDLRVTQQEKDALRHEVVSLHKQLQNAKDKNQILEIALHSSGFQNQHKKLYQEEMSRLHDQEQHLLRQDNERLQMEVCNTKGDLVHSREKVRQLETTVVSMKQQKNQSQSCLLKALEEENASLKQELESKAELDKSCDALERQDKLESLQQENDALKTQMTRLSSQLLEAFQAQLVGLLPPSPHRIPRAPRADDPDNMQDEKERERTMKRMEERMREIELSLHNVKLLLREKVAQLKEQLHKNGQADTLIRDLYVENNNLLKALEITEQRHKITEKRNYLLEEKIASLNKIVRELHPAPLLPVPLRFKCA